MNVQKLLLVCVLLGLGTAAAHAQNGIDPVQRLALIETLQKGQTFSSDGRSYRLLPQARATGMQKSETHGQAASRIGYAPADLLEKKGRFVLYRAAQTAPAMVQGKGAKASYPVVLNIETQRLGILPGTLTVRFPDKMDAEALAADHGLKLRRSFPHLNVAHYQVPAGKDILAVAAAVAADERVQSAEPEVIEHFRQPR